MTTRRSFITGLVAQRNVDSTVIRRREDLVGKPWEIDVWRGGNQFGFIADNWDQLVLILWRYGTREFKDWKKYSTKHPPVTKPVSGFRL